MWWIILLVGKNISTKYHYMLWSIMYDHKIIHVHGHEVGGAQQEICMHLALLSYLYCCACFEVSCTHDNNITHVNGMSGCGLTANIIYAFGKVWALQWEPPKYRRSAWSVVNSLPSVQHIHRYSSAPPSMSTWCIHVINGPRLSLFCVIANANQKMGEVWEQG